MANKEKANGKKKKTYIDYKHRKTSLVVGKKPDGSPERKYFYGKTKTEANHKKSEYIRQHALGIKLGDMSVEQWGKNGLSCTKRTRLKLRKNTIKQS